MNRWHFIADLAGGDMLVWLALRELQRILNERKRPIDTWIKQRKRYKFREPRKQEGDA